MHFNPTWRVSTGRPTIWASRYGTPICFSTSKSTSITYASVLHRAVPRRPAKYARSVRFVACRGRGGALRSAAAPQGSMRRLNADQLSQYAENALGGRGLDRHAISNAIHVGAHEALRWCALRSRRRNDRQQIRVVVHGLQDRRLYCILSIARNIGILRRGNMLCLELQQRPKKSENTICRTWRYRKAYWAATRAKREREGSRLRRAGRSCWVPAIRSTSEWGLEKYAGL